LTGLPVGDPVPTVEPVGEPAAMIEGGDVTLRSPDPGDAAALFPDTHGEHEAVWTYMGYGPFSDAAAMSDWIASTVGSDDPRWWTADVESGPVGMAALMNRDRANRRVEIGHIWYSPKVQRTTINTEVAYLLLRESFDRLASRRVEWKCDALNERSRAAALRLGFAFEGVFRNHMIVKGRNRDTSWYAMTDDEWPAVQARLEEWLYETRRENGKPIRPLSEV
jgi:RimJ/RimL family protein N-acetyltransferase